MKPSFQKSFRTTLPVLTGYLLLGAGFSMVAKEYGFSPFYSILMSLLVYAGSMQYVGIGLLADGASLFSIAVTTLMVNARHLFYGISMLERYQNIGRIKNYLIFSLTDETYSIVCHGEKNPNFYFWVSLLDHCYWITGTLLGVFLGSAFPFPTEGIDFVLTAMFITVFTDQWLHTKDHFPALCGIFVSVVCLILFGKEDFLIPAMLFITVSLLLNRFYRKEA